MYSKALELPEVQSSLVMVMNMDWHNVMLRFKVDKLITFIFMEHLTSLFRGLVDMILANDYHQYSKIFVDGSLVMDVIMYKCKPIMTVRILRTFDGLIVVVIHRWN